MVGGYRYLLVYRVAVINPEFFKYFLKMSQHSLISSNFFKPKKNEQMNILRIRLFNEMAISGNKILDFGP